MKLDDLKNSIKKGNLDIILDENFFLSLFLTEMPVADEVIQPCSWWLGSFFNYFTDSDKRMCNKGCAFSTCLICSVGCSSENSRA